MNALITGGSGFVGSHLVKKLLTLSYKVHVIILSDSNLDLLQDCIGNVTLHEYNHGYSSLDKAMKESNADVVFHLAS